MKIVYFYDSRNKLIDIEKKNKPITCLVSIASGFRPLYYLYQRGFDTTTTIIYANISYYALLFKKLMLVAWDGKDYPTFKKRFISKFPDTCIGSTEINLDEEKEWELIQHFWIKILFHFGINIKS